VDLKKKARSVRERSHDLKYDKHQSMHETPEDDENSSKALRELKRVNDYKDMLKGRLSFLQIQEEKNEFRAFMNEHRYQFHQHMRDEMDKER
jgi:hypothetical protein